MRDPNDRAGKENTRAGWLTGLGGAVALLLLLAVGYVGYQILHLLNPPNTYETVLMATVEDKVEADGVLLFTETAVPGSGDMGYLVEDGARVSAGTVVAEVYTSHEQSALRSELNSLNEQIDLLHRAENVSSTQVDSMIQERTTALYDMMDAADRGAFGDMDAGREKYLLAQNKILVVTGEASDFSAQITALQAQADQLQSRLGSLVQITAPLTGYFVRSTSTRQLTQSAEAVLAMDAPTLKAWLDGGADVQMTGGAGKIVSGFSWTYCGVCTAQQAQKLLRADGTPPDGHGPDPVPRADRPGPGRRGGGSDHRRGFGPGAVRAQLRLGHRGCAAPGPGQRRGDRQHHHRSAGARPGGPLCAGDPEGGVRPGFFPGRRG